MSDTLPTTIPTTLTIDERGAIRKFADSGVQAAVDAALASVHADAKGAVLAVADLKGAQLVVAARLAEGWSLVGVIGKPWQGDLEAQVALRWTW